MPNIRISALPPAILPLDDPNTLFEVTVLEAGEEVSRKISLSDIAASTGLDASFLTLSANAQLPNERVLTEGSNITFVDTGPNGTLTISASSTTSFPLLAPDGSAAAPSYSFASDPDSGMFLVGADILGLSAGGVEVARAVEAAGDVSLIIDPGNTATAAAPALAFGDGDSGFRQPLDDNLQVVMVGVSRFFWSLDSYNATAGTGPAMINVAASATVPGFVPRRPDPDTGLGSASSDQLSLIAGGVEIARATEAGAGNNQFAIVQSGSSTVPELTSLADPDTGFHWTGANQITALNGGSRSFHFTSGRFFSEFSEGPALLNTTAQLDVPTVLPDQADADTGLGSNGNDAMSIVAGGVEGIRVTEAAAAITVDIFGTLNTVAFNASGVAIFTGDVQIRDGSDFEIFDATNTNRALFTTRLGPPDTFEISGAGDLEHFDVRSFNTSVRIRDGIPLEMEEFTLSPSFVAGSGFFWVRDDVPNVPIFTDDAGTDFVLNAPAVSPDPLLLSSGGAGVPSYSFAADTDTGMFNPGLDSVGLTAGGILGLSVSEVAGAITVDILDNLTIDATTGPGPHLNFVNMAPGAVVIDFLPTGSTFYDIFKARDSSDTTFFVLRHDYSLSAPNHFLTFNSQSDNGILEIEVDNFVHACQRSTTFETDSGGSVGGVVNLAEGVNSPSAFAGRGKYWVRDDVPNTPMFTDDAGNEFELNAAVLVGTVTDSILRFDGSGYVEETQVQVSAAGTLSVFEATLTDSIKLIPDLISPTINFDGATNVNFTGPSAALGYLFDQGARFGNTLRINTTIPTLLFEIATVERAAMTALATSFTVDVGGQSSGNLFQINNSLVTMWSVDATNGMRVFETGAEVDFIETRHDGVDGNITVFNGLDLNFTGVSVGYKFDESIYITEKTAANADFAGLGQFWTRDDVPNIPMFTNDVGIDFKLGVANDAVQARRTTSFTITTAFTDVTLDTTDIETDDQILEHSGTTDNIEAQVAGTYEFTYGVDIDPSAAGNDNIQAFGRMRLNDAGVDIPGSLASQSAYEDASTIGNQVFGRLQCSFIVVLAAGDFVTLQLMKVETGGTGTFTAEEVTVTGKRLL